MKHSILDEDATMPKPGIHGPQLARILIETKNLLVCVSFQDKNIPISFDGYSGGCIGS